MSGSVMRRRRLERLEKLLLRPAFQPIDHAALAASLVDRTAALRAEDKATKAGREFSRLPSPEPAELSAEAAQARERLLLTLDTIAEKLQAEANAEKAAKRAERRAARATPKSSPRLVSKPNPQRATCTGPVDSRATAFAAGSTAAVRAAKAGRACANVVADLLTAEPEERAAAKERRGGDYRGNPGKFPDLKGQALDKIAQLSPTNTNRVPKFRYPHKTTPPSCLASSSSSSSGSMVTRGLAADCPSCDGRCFRPPSRRVPGGCAVRQSFGCAGQDCQSDKSAISPACRPPLSNGIAALRPRLCS
jgi:hypothetical protein